MIFWTTKEIWNAEQEASPGRDYRWRKEYCGLKTDQARRMKDLEKENARLRRAISDLTLDKLILQEAARGNF
jgi:cell division protein FtsB